MIGLWNETGVPLEGKGDGSMGCANCTAGWITMGRPVAPGILMGGGSEGRSRQRYGAHHGRWMHDYRFWRWALQLARRWHDRSDWTWGSYNDDILGSRRVSKGRRQRY